MFTIRELVPWRRDRNVENGRHDFEHALESFHRDINRLFEDFSRGFDLPFWGRAERGHDYISPRVDLSEDEKEIRFTVELPGMDEKDFEVVVSDNVLTIKGEKREMKEEKDRHYTYMERSFGAFQRNIPLDTDIVTDKIEAVFANGVLTVTLPKTPEAQKKYKKVPIQSGDKVRAIDTKAA